MVIDCSLTMCGCPMNSPCFACAGDLLPLFTNARSLRVVSWANRKGVKYPLDPSGSLWIPLVMTHIAIENHHLYSVFPSKMVIFHSYLSHYQRETFENPRNHRVQIQIFWSSKLLSNSWPRCPKLPNVVLTGALCDLRIRFPRYFEATGSTSIRGKISWPT